MLRISRARRAELAHRAAHIRRRGQRADWDVATIADEIARQLPELKALEVWRLAYGWSRPQVVAAICEVFEQDGLAPPGLTPARLCRWEHNGVQPEADYAAALARVYQVSPWRLGLNLPGMLVAGRYGRPTQPSEPGVVMVNNALTAVADSVQLQREIEGPGGGPATHEQAQRAIDYYASHYPRYAPTVLAGEIHRCRQMVVDMLTHPQHDRARTELRRLAGWLSALLGDLAFTCSDYAGAHIHLGTGARLGTSIGEHRLAGWSLGAQSMVAFFGDRPADALDLAHQAREYADTPLRRAQITAWCELRALAALGRRSDAEHAATRAQHHMDAADDEPGRMGFDRAELHQHLAESALRLDDTPSARHHAATAISLKSTSSGGWAAATVILARAHAAEHNPADATALATTVLDTVSPAHLRETTRRRLAALDADLHTEHSPAATSRELRERLRALPAHTPAPRTSPEPNGH
ncbi:hypothetical protein SAMN05216215_101892 [Saccharopolyspora shandongensis]|uniref:HTH cro/C1-type domain-containing protein n=1 Tax=Saccharopolyspora shandongensis TaxID=418495 RepID=A0A1H3G8X3_9PSEU|nr:hypothetical protein [Saccharopolyspora shandongensis]SDX99793.1 hypothetical protein SAMN05216215_101892 [Saccharopolyspora shandongensis]